MGRPAMVSRREAINVVKNFIQHFETDQIPNYTSHIWKDMSDDLGNKWNSHNMYTHVRENRRNILTIARQEMGIVVINIKHERLTDERLENESSFNPTSDFSKMNKTKFKLVLTEEEWNLMKPKRAKGPLRRDKYVLTPWVWTNIVATAFWKQYKLNCTFIFKRSVVKISADRLSYEITVLGKCKSTACGNTFVGKATKNINELGGLIMEVETRDTRQEIHESKRQFRSIRKKHTEKELISEECAVWKKHNAQLIIEIDD